MIKIALPLLLIVSPISAAAQVLGIPDFSELTDEQVRAILEHAAEGERLRREGRAEEYAAWFDAQDPDSFHALCRPDDGEIRRFEASRDLPEMNVALDDSGAELVNQFPQYFPYAARSEAMLAGPLISSEMMRLAIDIGGETLRLNSGGMGNVINDFNLTPFGGELYSISAYDQQCAITVDEALKRAARLEAALERAGFTRDPEMTALAARESVGGGRVSATLPDWEAARADLLVTPRRYAEVSSQWVRENQYAIVTVHNWGGRADPDADGPLASYYSQTVFEIDGTGRKYGVEISIGDIDALEADMDRHLNQVETGE